MMVAIVQGSSSRLDLEDRHLAYYLQELIRLFDICHLLTAYGFAAYCIWRCIALHLFNEASGLPKLQLLSP